MKNEEEIDYNHDLAAEFILDNISDELFAKLSRNDVLILLKLDEDFIEVECQRNEKKKPYIAIELVGMKQEDINYYVRKNAIKHNIILNEEEIDEIMNVLVDYLYEIGKMWNDDDDYRYN